MQLEKKIDYCLIDSGSKYIIVFTYNGKHRVDEKLCNEADYQKLKMFVEEFGYYEVDGCVFESQKFSHQNIQDIANALADAGLNYSIPLQETIINSFNQLIKGLSAHEIMYEAMNNTSETPIDIVNYELVPGKNKQLPPPVPFTKPDIEKEKKFKVPKIGEKITVYFYMFLHTYSLGNMDFRFDITGDLYNNENAKDRNFIGITKSEFIRIKDSKPGIVELMSVKTQADLLKEISFVYRGCLNFMTRVVNGNGIPVVHDNAYTYNIIEVYKHIMKDAKIFMSCDLMELYQSLVIPSKIIEDQYKKYREQTIEMSLVKEAALILKEKLVIKKEEQVKKELYEKAAILKKDIEYIDKKLKILDGLKRKKLKQKEYIKKFSVIE